MGAIFRDSGEFQCNRPLTEEHAASQKGHFTCGAIFGLGLRNSASVQQSRYISLLYARVQRRSSFLS